MRPQFDIVFNLFMILFPALFSLFIRVRSDGADEDLKRLARVRDLRRQVYIATAATAAAFGILYGNFSPEIASFMWLSFFPLWQITLPLLQAKDAGWRPWQPAPMTIGTSVKRKIEPRLGWRWAISWTLCLAVFAATVLGLLQTEGSPPWWLGALPLFGALELAGARWALGRALLEPEPIGPYERLELEQAWAKLRRLKTRAWYWGATGAMLAFSLPALLIAWCGEGGLTAAIVLGAGGGTMLGVLGAITGIKADLHRAEIHRRYQALARRPSRP